MLLENLILKKEELPILYENCFQVPIHPKLLNPNIEIDKNLARTVFPRAAEEWYNDLVEHLKILEEGNKRWIKEVFLKKKPKIRKEYGYQMLSTLNWKDTFFTWENGFAYSLSINRNNGGTLYFNREDVYHKTFVPLNISTDYIQFSRNKSLEFCIGGEVIKLENGVEGVEVYVYNMHNVDHYPGALFLRNWAIFYLNEAIKQVSK